VATEFEILGKRCEIGERLLDLNLWVPETQFG
jgi:hypothetical protein